MPKINTVEPQGAYFIVHSTDWDIQFSAMDVTVEGKAGDVLESVSKKVDDLSTSIVGILAEDTDGTEGFKRVMVRGNPSQVDMQKINIGLADPVDVAAWLEEKSIITVNH